MRWKTEEMVKLFEGLGAKVEVSGPGGDCDTDNLILTAPSARDARLYVCGFITDGDITDPSDTDVDMVEVTDGQDSRGGLNTSDGPTALLYAEVCTALRKQKFNVVPQMKDYF